MLLDKLAVLAINFGFFFVRIRQFEKSASAKYLELFLVCAFSFITIKKLFSMGISYLLKVQLLFYYNHANNTLQRENDYGKLR